MGGMGIGAVATTLCGLSSSSAPCTTSSSAPCPSSKNGALSLDPAMVGTSVPAGATAVGGAAAFDAAAVAAAAPVAVATGGSAEHSGLAVTGWAGEGAFDVGNSIGCAMGGRGTKGIGKAAPVTGTAAEGSSAASPAGPPLVAGCGAPGGHMGCAGKAGRNGKACDPGRGNKGIATGGRKYGGKGRRSEPADAAAAPSLAGPVTDSGCAPVDDVTGGFEGEAVEEEAAAVGCAGIGIPGRQLGCTIAPARCCKYEDAYMCW
jgi:hypothetical protein